LVDPGRSRRRRAARQALIRSQKERSDKEAKARAEKLPKGLRGLWSRITGKYKKLVSANEADARLCQQRDRKERHAMVSQQLEKRRMLQTVIKQERARHAELLSSLRRMSSGSGRLNGRRSRPARLRKTAARAAGGISGLSLEDIFNEARRKTAAMTGSHGA